MPPSLSDPSRWKLSWTAQPPANETLPETITRSFIETASGKLEILSSIPNSPTKVPLLFLHGGFGRASEYADFLAYFSSLSHPAYAISVRGHGHSWCPSFLRMCFFTTAYMLATDAAAGVAYVRESHSQSPVLIAHSNGGGLAQIVLDRGLESTSGLVLLSGTPNFGGMSVYRSWLMNDPWFLPRMYFRDFGHPRSPLSSTELVRKAFFSAMCPIEKVRKCEQGLSEYESLMWPLAIMRRFVDAKRVLDRCRKKILVMGADEDALMRVDDMRRMAAEYREAGEEANHIQFEEVPKSGHSIHLDVNWRLAASMIAKWLVAVTY